MTKNLIKLINKILTGAALGFVITSSAYATTINAVDTEKSSLDFKYQQMGVSMDGKFEKFNAEIDFDPENYAAGQVQFQVDLSSVNTGTSDGDDEVVNSDWFNVDEHPTAIFTSNNIEQNDSNSYTVNGTLNIKGTEINLDVPATFTPTDDGGSFVGEFTINRSDFNIGEGAWSTFEIIANEVTINFSIFTLSK